MDKEYYVKKMYEHLNLSWCYKKLKMNTLNKIMKDVYEAIKMSSLDDDIKKKLIPSFPLIPRIYGLPKIHKDRVPLGPIANTIGFPTYLFTKFLLIN